MPDYVRRALRTFIQIGVVQGAIQLYNAFAAVPLNATQVAAITTFATPVVALVQNLLEDQSGMPALWKAPASPGANPVPDSGPKIERH